MQRAYLELASVNSRVEQNKAKGKGRKIVKIDCNPPTTFFVLEFKLKINCRFVRNFAKNADDVSN